MFLKLVRPQFNCIASLYAVAAIESETRK